ncbi:MAG: dihydrolipoyllysine-residue acetyltransferase [Pseudomonadales bacterium]
MAKKAEEIRIPDIGDIEEVEVIEICVAVGDSVGPDDTLIVIESDKASMDVPAGVSGVIEEISVQVGDKVAEGHTIARIAGEGADTGADTAAASGSSGAGESQSDQSGRDESAAAESEVAESVAVEPDSSVAASDAAAPAGAAEQETSATNAADAEKSKSDSSEPATERRKVEIRVPEIGDASGVVVIEVGVKAGDTVSADDLLVVVESDKASMEIPAGEAGTVEAVHVEVGAEVEEGTLLATLRLSGDGVSAPAEEDASAGPAAGKKGGDSSQQTEKPEAATPTAEESPAGATGVTTPERVQTDDGADREQAQRVYAGPAVRRLARELGVALSRVKGSGARGRIVKDDVKRFVKQTLGAPPRVVQGASAVPPIPRVDFSRFGPVRSEALSRIRLAGAANLHRSWLNLPHVTQFNEADVTDLEAFRGSLKAEAERRGIKLTPLAFIIKACCHALKAHPHLNASLDLDAGNFILKDYFHIGMAVDTPDGLVVPVIRDADRKGLWELSEAIVELSTKARELKLGLNDMQGGTFSVSSLGAIGGTGFTPIINAPEVAILGVSQLSQKPVWNGTEFGPRSMLPLSLSYDHRAINGAEAGRFMASLTEVLADIRRLAL